MASTASHGGYRPGVGVKPTISLTCLACAAVFGTPLEQKEHYRSDWHRYNLKRKLAELPPISAEGFARRLQCAVACLCVRVRVCAHAQCVCVCVCVCTHKPLVCAVRARGACGPAGRGGGG